MKTVQSIRAQIEKLQAEEQEFIERERGSVIQRCLDAIMTYRITPEELFDSEGQARIQAQTPIKKTRTKVSGYKFGATYSDGVNTWVGRGPIPGWLKAHGDIEKFITNTPFVEHSTRPGRKVS